MHDLRDAEQRPLDHELTPAEQSLLRSRANRYARAVQTDVHDVFDAMVFERAGARYAAAVSELRAVRHMEKLCRIPGTRSVVTGVFCHRGEIVSVHDLDALVRNDLHTTHGEWVVIAEFRNHRVGLMADDVHGVATLAATSIHPLPVTFRRDAGGFRGITGDDVFVLDIPGLFGSDEFIRAY
jgi:chemotaxis signal transduction protein